MTDFQKKLKRLSKRRGITGAEAGRRLGVSRQAIQITVKRMGLSWPCPSCGAPSAPGKLWRGPCPTCRATRAQRAADPAPAQHCVDCGGPIVGRGKQALRCIPCHGRERMVQAAKAEARANAALKRAATRDGVSWEPWEDELLTGGLPLRAVAKKLSRTLFACQHRRHVLRTQQQAVAV